MPKKEKKNKMDAPSMEDIMNVIPDEGPVTEVGPEPEEEEAPVVQSAPVEAPAKKEAPKADNDDSKMVNLYKSLTGANVKPGAIMQNKFKIVKDAWMQRKPRIPYPGYDDALKILSEEL